MHTCSFMTGRSPQSTGVYNFIDSFREEGFGMEWTAMPQFFKQHGWWAAGGGKVYHPGHPPNNDMPYSWDVYFKANGDDHGCRDNETLGWCCGLSGSNVCPSDEPDSAFYDWVLANDTISQLAQHAQRRSDGMRGTRQPFFIAAGLRRPHRVWHVPRRFYDLYANNGTHPTKMPLALHKTGPEGMPELAFIDNAWPNFGYNQSVPIDDWRAELGRWGYYASVSFTDSNVGMMLDALDRLALDDETVVLFTGDVRGFMRLVLCPTVNVSLYQFCRPVVNTNTGVCTDFAVQHGWELGEHGE
jgi:iduronate 2-sulfatase